MSPPDPTFDRALLWLRRDLRSHDHAAWALAQARARHVWVAFVLDSDILDALPRQDRRVEFILQALGQIHTDLAAVGSGLVVLHGRAAQQIPRLAQALGAQAVFASHDDDPHALARDAQVAQTLTGQGCAWHSVKDHVIFERREVLTGAGQPYGVYTPYWRNWSQRLSAADVRDHAVDLARPGGHPPWPDAVIQAAAQGQITVPAQAPGVPTLAQTGFEPTNLNQLGLTGDRAGVRRWLDDFRPRLAAYGRQRDQPALKGPSYLGVHLRFGTLSVRELIRLALDELGCSPGELGRHSARTPASSAAPERPGALVWIQELVWRDFYHQILANFPHVAQGAFRRADDALVWEEGAVADRHFAAWCAGRTGYPLVDAAQRQLLQTGYMHNRLRMVSASFLIKDLGIGWQRGEAFFAQHLLDFDLASNNGGWQWAASTGCDAQPWFRIFNPWTQSRTFDAEGRFIRRYLPELARVPAADLHEAKTLARHRTGLDYPLPLVDHAQARVATLARYEAVRGKAQD
ncbi:cryptochrome/photolyase family protein [Amphibiibacter pelophylacis]|uniref:Deoxyribodipyrimidine photo-lyase n=1 Tax=Amphibiibacter pelophylacis TaxID=1799477 RepID=A0ACC6NZS5_9BURK